MPGLHCKREGSGNAIVSPLSNWLLRGNFIQTPTLGRFQIFKSTTTQDRMLRKYIKKNLLTKTKNIFSEQNPIQIQTVELFDEIGSLQPYCK